MSSQHSPDILDGARAVVLRLGSMKAGESVCIVSDDETREVGNLLAAMATEAGGDVKHIVVAPLPAHGTEPAAEVAAAMSSSRLCIGVTGKSMAHTKARLDVCAKGGRYLSLPEYSLEMLAHPALRVDYKGISARVREVTNKLTAAKRVRVVAPGGTDVTLDVTDRIGNFCPGYVDDTNALGSPPDIECNVSPVEDGSNGKVVVDGSIAFPGFGLMPTPVTLDVRQGVIRDMVGPREILDALEKLFAPHGEKARVLAEFGIGFNPKAELSGNMLMDEGCHGTFHFGFGSNATVGGKNRVPFHLDFIFRANQFFADDELIRIS